MGRLVETRMGRWMDGWMDTWADRSTGRLVESPMGRSTKSWLVRLVNDRRFSGARY